MEVKPLPGATSTVDIDATAALAQVVQQLESLITATHPDRTPPQSGISGRKRGVKSSTPLESVDDTFTPRKSRPRSPRPHGKPRWKLPRPPPGIDDSG